MIISKYLHLFEKEGDYFIYSSLSNSLARIDKDLFNQLSDHKLNLLDKSSIDQDIWNILKSMKIVDTDDKFEISKIKFSRA